MTRERKAKKPRNKKKSKKDGPETSQETSGGTESERTSTPTETAPMAKRGPARMEPWRRLSGPRLVPISLRPDDDEEDENGESEMPIKPYMKLIPAAVVVFIVVSSTVAVVVLTTLQNGALTGQSAARSPVAQSDSRSATDVAVPLLTPETNEGDSQPFNFSGNGAENATTGVGDAAPWRQKRR
ncbi:uncharacterized protein [Dermacentor andersoni]|uniref:uncharacterized protein n=1 Tax=Dermacentor andersoni TaxID=34620 RepID=UPI0024162FA3|nr:uncharacterized protein LOC129380176 [Dermacentor andersoni]